VRHHDIFLDGTAVITSDGTTSFVFSKGRHREFRFEDATTFRAHIAAVLSLKRAALLLNKSDGGTYLKQRIIEQDPEWMDVWAQLESKDDWKKLAR
jgi:hypothetical protein